jgi:hypothetical protein
MAVIKLDSSNVGIAGSSLPTTKDPAAPETEEEWRDP